MRTRWLMIASVLAVVPLARGDDWLQFRGPNSAGVTTSKDLPQEWGADKNVQWKIKAPGRGWSSPVVVGDKVFLTAAWSEKEPARPAGGGRPGGGRPGGGGPPGGGGRPGGGFGRGTPKPPDYEYKFEIVCLDRATGKELWRDVALNMKPRVPTHQQNTYASETPVSDGEYVYAYFGMHGLFCYDLNGQQVWKKDLGTYPMMMGWGTSSSPVLDEERIFVQVDNEEKSFIVALNKKTGDEVWRESRGERSNWGSPLLWKNSKRSELVTPGSQKVRSYDPSSGKLLWELNLGGGRCNTTPVADGDVLYVGVSGMPGGGGGFGRPGGGPPGGGAPPGGGGRPGGGGGRGGGGALFAVKAGGSGDITPKAGATSSDGVLWALKAGPGMASPLVYQGYVYILEQNGGMVSCYNAQTGKAEYVKERIPQARAFWASPWAYDGKIFCLDESGTTHVLKAGPEFKVLGKNSLSGDQFWATPALAGDTVIMRGVESVYGIKK